MTPADITAALAVMSTITPDLPHGVAIVTATGHEITGRVTLEGNTLRVDSLCTCGKVHQPVFIACSAVALLRGVDADMAERRDGTRDAMRELMKRLSGDDSEGEGDAHVVNIKRFN